MKISLPTHQNIALATVLQTWGSAPRQAGAKMIISADGTHSGSVSGGCVEGAVIATAQTVLQSGIAEHLHFGVSDATAWDVGLACGGEIDILVEKLTPDEQQNLAWFWQPTEIGIVITNLTNLPTGPLEKQVHQGEQLPIDDGHAGMLRPHLQQVLQEKKSRRVKMESGLDVFIDINLPPAQLIIVGGAHIAIPLTEMAKTIGLQIRLIDPRRAFGNPERFPEADQVLQAWPDQAFAELTITSNTAIVMLTHDPKIDDPALLIALNSPAYYIGALGSRKTQAQRRERLLAAGITQTQIERIYGPVGLNLGGRQPAEIALAILAEIVQVRNQNELTETY